MAILSNGKFYGFLCSAKETGQKLANGVKEYVEDFVSGFAGHGWKIWEYMKGKWKLEIDTIVVRETMLVFEMLISKIRAIIGAQAITQGHGKVKSVNLSDDGTEYLIELEDEDMSIVAHDFVRCQTFTGDNSKLYHVEVSSVDVETRTLHVPLTEFAQDEAGNVLNPPVAGDELVQFGNSQNKSRQSAIYMHADETGQPAIDVMFDIDSKNWDGKVKVRVGGDIPGANGLKGFYCVNGMIKSVDDKGATIYEFSPNGAVNIGKGNITYNPTTNKVTLGSGVTLTWDNLSDESKENLKGEPGQDGLNGQDGADGVNGADGVSLVYKGEFASHPDNPENGWYYRNTSDKKCYVYQDNAWYVMTVDGSDGKNGLDGVNGKDGNDGLDIVWKGDSSTPPANPQKNWVYRDTDNGRVYIYNGMAWQLMVADGNDGVDGTDGAPGADGTDGMSVYITYHDSESEPIKPTGDGTTGGWHTDATNAVVWMSQKVSDSASTGEWGNPIKIKGDIGKPGQDANLLPWIEEWNGYATELGKEYIVTPKMFSGVRNADGTLTGIAQGKDCLTDASGNKRTGIFALVDDEIVFEMDPESGKYRFKGKIESDEILINDFTKLSSAVFCGDYMYSQTGINAAGEVSEEYQLFDPSTIGQPDAPFTPNILLDFNKGSGHLGAGKILFDSDGTIELNSVSLNNSIASGASHFTGEALPTYLQVTSQYVISTLSSATGGYTYLNVPTQRYGGKLNLKLNQAIDITVINMSPQVLSLGIYDMRYQSGRGKFKCYYSTIWKEVWPVSTETKEVNTITVPQYYPVELIFIPTNIRGAWYEGTWLIKNSYAYQLYYHPRAADFLQYDLVPIDASPMKTK